VSLARSSDPTICNRGFRQGEGPCGCAAPGGRGTNGLPPLHKALIDLATLVHFSQSKGRRAGNGQQRGSNPRVSKRGPQTGSSASIWRRGRDLNPIHHAQTAGQTGHQRRVTRKARATTRLKSSCISKRGPQTGSSASIWRRGRDLNPRGSFKPPTRLAGERLRPLGHLSGYREVIRSQGGTISRTARRSHRAGRHRQHWRR
jgi:hypothetical protein